MLNILIGVVITIVLITIAALIFIKVWSPVGGSVSSEDKKDYSKRADNYKNGKFINKTERSIMGSWSDPYFSRTTGKGKKPKDTLPAMESEILGEFGKEDFTVTWFGHSTLLMQISGMNILIDPVFSKVTSPVSFVGAKRFSPLGIKSDNLPHIDICIISHDHYDHLDYDSILEINDKVDLFIVPLGIEKHLEKWNVSKDKIQNMAWWEEKEINGLTIGCTPGKHFSGRYLFDSGQALWASWVFINDYIKVFETGDTGYSPHFEEIAEKYGDFDFVMTECAQYNKVWHDVHMFPEEAIEAVKTLGSSVVMPVHWGAFCLSNHSWDDPAERVTLYGEENGITVLTPLLGQTVNWKQKESYQDRWWRKYN
ncbi:MBL fold metallo-hydrolase [Anaerosporobacter sp.]|uniref:MBL fold metallo-hydrolase n=1 Tax=Anaerosporobacter sp. TaxID=1872529 RepID=UPI00286F7C5F|nr:MBL fold metallo-hydrolase [Anaerosporobacter sp.]